MADETRWTYDEQLSVRVGNCDNMRLEIHASSKNNAILTSDSREDLVHVCPAVRWSRSTLTSTDSQDHLQYALQIRASTNATR